MIVVSACVALFFACGGEDTSKNENNSNTEQNETAESSNEQSNSNFHPTGGGMSPTTDFNATLNGNQMTIFLTLREDAPEWSYSHLPLSASMIFVDDAGHLLTLTGGDCQTFYLPEQGLTMTVTFNPNEDFTYATFRTFTFSQEECNGRGMIEFFVHIFKNDAGNIRFIDENEYYAHSASQEDK